VVEFPFPLRGLAVGALILLVSGLGFAEQSRADGTPASGSSTFSEGPSSSGSGSVRVHWSATCPNPGDGPYWYWSIEISAYHEDGTRANYHSTAESAVVSDSRTQTLGLRMAPGLRTERFRIRVIFSCYPQQPASIGESSITLVRKRPSGGSAGGGDGSSGGGSGSGGGKNGGGGANGGDGGGGLHCIVPKLKGRSLSRAEELLVRAHCRLGKLTAPHVGKRVKLVVRSSKPRAGTHLPNGARVDLTLRIRRPR
jgi:hypothetical protein